MKKIQTFYLLFFIFSYIDTNGQITVNDTFSAEDLVLTKLINSPCANVENFASSGGTFANSINKSYGYFEVGSSNFPFQNGVVLTSSRAIRAVGPNNSELSEGNLTWRGDFDLETALGTSNTMNATVLEFDFIPVSAVFSFNYIFASEEYTLAYPCFYSDGFAFLLKPVAGNEPYQNLAIIPNTTIPVSSTSIRPLILGASGCPANNLAYFNGYNSSASATNFNGQTVVMTAKATVIPGVKYHIKLVVADQDDFRMDSAIFIEGGSFKINVDLGPNRTLQDKNPVCANENIVLNATVAGTNSYQWFRNNILLPLATQPTYNATQNGTYKVQITAVGLPCVTESSIRLQFATPFSIADKTIKQCDTDLDLITTVNLRQVEPEITVDFANCVFNYYQNQAAANSQTAAFLIQDPSVYNNLNGNIIWVHVQSAFGCVAVVKLNLTISATQLPLNYSQTLSKCDDFIDSVNNENDGISRFDFATVSANLSAIIPNPNNYELQYYKSEFDFNMEFNAQGQSLAIQNISNYRNTGFPTSQTIWIKVKSTLDNSCFGFGKLFLIVEKSPDVVSTLENYICFGSLSDKRISSGLNNANPLDFSFKWFKNETQLFGQTNETLVVDAEGIYVCELTNGQTGCSARSTHKVTFSEKAIISSFIVNDLVENNSLSVSVTGRGIYEFSIDNPSGPFQSNGNFINIAPGFHTLYINDLRGCEMVSKIFAILGSMTFFTPNGDSFNDSWQIKGVGTTFNEKSKVQIFDRFGRFIYEIKPGDAWDGTFNGQQLPADDYWFILSLEDGRSTKGHFSLKR